MVYVPSSKKQNCRDCGKPNAIKPKKLCPTCLKSKKKNNRAKARDAHAVKTYGLLPGELAKLDKLAPLGESTCWICGSKAGGRLNTDHNHQKVGRESVRGRLCTVCNKYLLGMVAHEDWKRLQYIAERAVIYLQEEPAQSILKDE